MTHSRQWLEACGKCFSMSARTWGNRSESLHVDAHDKNATETWKRDINGITNHNLSHFLLYELTKMPHQNGLWRKFRAHCAG